MQQWLVELLGDRYYLEEIPYFFAHGDVRGTTEEDKVFLVASSFESQTEPARVFAIANELVDNLTAALAVHIGHFVRPKIGAVLRQGPDGTRTAHHFLQASSSTVHSKSRLGIPPSGPTYPQLFLKVGASSVHLQHAMLIWADPARSWPKLYRIMEEVQQFLGAAPYKAGLCTKDAQKRFEHTANSAEVAGMSARHALHKYDPPANPMNLDEATNFVGAVLQAVLKRASGTF